MRDAPPIVGRSGVLLTVQLLSGEHIPQSELGLEPALALRDAAGHKRLRIDRAPVGKARQIVDAIDLFDESCRVDRGKKARPLQVGRDDLTDVASGRRIGSCDRTNSGMAIGTGATLP